MQPFQGTLAHDIRMGAGIMYRYDREWKDPRDGRMWTVCGVWPSTETLMGHLFFESDAGTWDTWYVACHGVEGISEAELQGLVDLARERAERNGHEEIRTPAKRPAVEKRSDEWRTAKVPTGDERAAGESVSENRTTASV